MEWPRSGHGGWRDRPRTGRVLRQRQMCPRLVIVRQVLRHDAGQPDFIQDDLIVETFASNEPVTRSA